MVDGNVLQGFADLLNRVDDVHMVQQEAMYRRRASLYDVIYQWKDYQSDVARVRELLHEQGIADGSRVLEAACGTGAYLQLLRSWFEVSGFDLYEEMLTIARDKLGPKVPVFAADMTSFTVDQPFDALLCLFSSIGYAYPIERLQSTAQHFAQALRPGGVCIIEPWLDPTMFRHNIVNMQHGQLGSIKACRASRSWLEGEISVTEFQWLVCDVTCATVEHFTEQHRLWMCPRETMLRTFEEAGLHCRLEADGLMPGRGLFVCRKPENAG